MSFDLYSIEYLKDGSPRQQRAYHALTTLALIPKLEEISGGMVVLAGSLPIDIAVEDSDLDIITQSDDLKGFSESLKAAFGHYPNFRTSRGIVLGVSTLLTGFDAEDEHFEIFTQATPVPRQNAVLHLLIEARLLEMGGINFRQSILAARAQGQKTEEAFGSVLGLEGDPYRELLDLEELTDDQLRDRFF